MAAMLVFQNKETAVAGHIGVPAIELYFYASYFFLFPAGYVRENIRASNHVFFLELIKLWPGKTTYAKPGGGGGGGELAYEKGRDARRLA